jgi:hypothetical protein
MESSESDTTTLYQENELVLVIAQSCHIFYDLASFAYNLAKSDL